MEKFIYFVIVVAVTLVMVFSLDLRFTDWEYWVILGGLVGSNIAGLVEGKNS